MLIRNISSSNGVDRGIFYFDFDPHALRGFLFDLPQGLLYIAVKVRSLELHQEQLRKVYVQEALRGLGLVHVQVFLNFMVVVALLHLLGFQVHDCLQLAVGELEVCEYLHLLVLADVVVEDAVVDIHDVLVLAEVGVAPGGEVVAIKLGEGTFGTRHFVVVVEGDAELLVELQGFLVFDEDLDWLVFSLKIEEETVIGCENIELLFQLLGQLENGWEGVEVLYFLLFFSVGLDFVEIDAVLVLAGQILNY